MLDDALSLFHVLLDRLEDVVLSGILHRGLELAPAGRMPPRQVGTKRPPPAGAATVGAVVVAVRRGRQVTAVAAQAGDEGVVIVAVVVPGIIRRA